MGRELLSNELIINVIFSSILIALECFDRIPDWIPDSLSGFRETRGDC